MDAASPSDGGPCRPLSATWAPVEGTWQEELQTLVAEWAVEGGEEPSVQPRVEEASGLPEAELAAESPEPESDPCSSGTADSPLVSFRERLRKARPAAAIASRVQWSRLVAAFPADALHGLEASEAEERAAAELPRLGSRGRARRRKGTCVEVNSGGQVFFGLLSARDGEDQEEGVAFKFCNSRHRRQSEQMAAELAWHLGVGAPESKLLLRAHDEEWQDLKAAAEPLCECLGELLATKQSLLVMQFVPGDDLHEEQTAWTPEHLAASATSVGRLLVLDMLLGNADRLPIHSLSWRGNPSNVLWSSARGGGDRCAPIDALVARRPPRLLVQEEDHKVGRALELALLDAASAQELLLEAVACNPAATAAVEQDWVARQRYRAAMRSAGASGRRGPSAKGRAEGEAPEAPADAVKAFHEGVRSALTLAVQEQGLLEMVAGAIREWFDEFHAELACVASKADWRSRTAELKELSKEAERNEQVKRRWGEWQERLQRRSLELWRAAGDWAVQRNLPVAMSFKGFLGASVLNPIMDTYELFVRLQHLVARIKVMASAGSATRPCDLSPSPLLTGPATAAGCFHLLRKLGVTLVLNCTADLPAPSEAELGGDIRWHRVTLEDVEDQDLSEALEEGLQLLDEAASSGGRALIHCHEGRSRSVSVALAYLVAKRRQPLAEAFAFVKARNPRARPNAGFWRQLTQLELRELGSSSAAEVPEGVPKGKPKGLVCDLCGETVGLTEEAMSAHKKHKHKEEAAVE